ncbi:MAG: hypothetical protein GX444_09360 [Myxococcales bacterium]|nr:hypothetical protein [Myxococcales bacterium]
MQSTPRKKIKHFNDPGQAHFLTFSCFQRLPLLTKQRPIHWFLSALSKTCRNLDYSLWGYVIMPEHIHLVIHPKTDEYDISAFLQAIKQPVSRVAKSWLSANDPHWLSKLTIQRSDGKKEFHFWQSGGGYDRNVFTEGEARQKIEYLHYNPVRRGLVNDPLEWKWSSARWWEVVGKYGIDLSEY